AITGSSTYVVNLDSAHPRDDDTAAPRLIATDNRVTRARGQADPVTRRDRTQARPLDPSMALHPRNYAVYPRFLARHVREQGLMPLPEAAWRMTGYPAARFRLPGRGRIAEGPAAD